MIVERRNQASKTVACSARSNDSTKECMGKAEACRNSSTKKEVVERVNEYGLGEIKEWICSDLKNECD